MNKFKRISVIVIDSLGIGPCDDSINYNDKNPDTFGHICAKYQSINIPNLTKLGLTNLQNKGNFKLVNPIGYYHKAHELSKGKDTITGHYEFMGIKTTNPNITFTQTGFPKDLMDELVKQTGHEFIGNYAASGTEIIKELGAEHLKTKKLIIYTSADSVLQIAAHEELIGLDEIMRVCQIARDITADKPEWRVGRVIARPFIGDSPDNFKRTSNRHDFALNPPIKSVLDELKENNYDVISIGKINDIFNGCGITKALKSKSSVEGMDQSIQELVNGFNGLLFTNLVDFDALWGHRRNVLGYKEQLEQFDVQLDKLIKVSTADDLIIICADHGNDPTAPGSDHTREYIPIIYYSKAFKGAGLLPISNSFANIGATICENFNLKAPIIGISDLKYLK